MTGPTHSHSAGDNELPDSAPVSARMLLHLGSPLAVDQSLSRLARSGKLLRAGRGMYVSPSRAGSGLMRLPHIVLRRASTSAARSLRRPVPRLPMSWGPATQVRHRRFRYVSKSDFPRELLATTGLRAVGSKIDRVRPQSWGVDKHPDEAYTETLYVAGTRSRFREWQAELPRWTELQKGTLAISKALEPMSR